MAVQNDAQSVPILWQMLAPGTAEAWLMCHKLLDEMHLQELGGAVSPPSLAYCVHSPKERKDWNGTLNETRLRLCNCFFAGHGPARAGAQCSIF